MYHPSPALNMASHCLSRLHIGLLLSLRSPILMMARHLCMCPWCSHDFIKCQWNIWGVCVCVCGLCVCVWDISIVRPIKLLSQSLCAGISLRIEAEQSATCEVKWFNSLSEPRWTSSFPLSCCFTHCSSSQAYFSSLNKNSCCHWYILSKWTYRTFLDLFYTFFYLFQTTAFLLLRSCFKFLKTLLEKVLNIPCNFHSSPLSVKLWECVFLLRSFKNSLGCLTAFQTRKTRSMDSVHHSTQECCTFSLL